VTIGEAHAVNTLLSYLLGKQPYPGSGNPVPGGAHARAAAELLTVKAHAALAAGWSPVLLERAWPAKTAAQASPPGWSDPAPPALPGGPL
jgi:hypothetical protein